MAITTKKEQKELDALEREAPQRQTGNPRRHKICPICGKPFFDNSPYNQSTYCHNPCKSPWHDKPVYNRCSECGRRITPSRFLKNVPLEERLCSFCIQRKQAEKNAQRENEKRKALQKCPVCLEFKYLYRRTGICLACFHKSEKNHACEIIEVVEKCQNKN